MNGDVVTAPELEHVETFRIVSFDFDPAKNTARFDYAFDDAHSFRETVELGGPPLGSPPGKGIERALRLVHLAAGVSYYKAAAPERIVVETGPLSRGEAGLVHDLYDKGLREFAVANQLQVPIDFELRIEPERGHAPGGVAAGVPAGTWDVAEQVRDAPRPGIAVPIGGGKDSIVLVEALKAAGPAEDVPTWLVAINKRPAMERIAQVAGLPFASITRTISPRLLELNSAGALNGHVPITAIVSLIAVAAGYVYGYDTTLMALERSADEATALIDGVAVNHQWSKSTECELGLRSVIRESVSSSIEYCSGLRSCGELEIARWFAGLPAYHSGFRSCNQVFRSGAQFDGWCGRCPKCRFVFLVLAPFLDPGHLSA
ncbi:MAG: endonuclease domain-containing protein, partial [Acidimicrobiales bacterium]